MGESVKTNNNKKEIFTVLIPKIIITVLMFPPFIYCCIFTVIAFFVIPNGIAEFFTFLFCGFNAAYFLMLLIVMWKKYYEPELKTKIKLSILSAIVIGLDFTCVMIFLEKGLRQFYYGGYIPAFVILTVLGVLFSVSLIWDFIKPNIRYPVMSAMLICFVLFALKTHNDIIRKSAAMRAENNTEAVRQTIDLWNYLPFSENTEVVLLNEPSTLKLDSELPVMDGATAFYPFYAAFARAVYPEKDYRWNSEVMCNTTEYAYENLIDGKADIIFALTPSQEHWDLAREKGVELELTPIGKEAFVFFVNTENPVDNLSAGDIKAIYSGRSKNWRAFGGDDKDIRAYQREANSGSQTIMLEFMGETPLMNPPTIDIQEDMISIIGAVADYRNHDNSIGYSFRFFSTQMVNDNRIKHLSIDGIKPTKETVANGTYPLTYDFYLITAGTKNPNVPALIDWILSEQGQYIISETGYVPIN